MMITYVTLLLITLCIAIIAYILFDKEILSPTFISTVMFGIGVLFSSVGALTWNRVESLNIKTIFIIVIGLLAFLLGELVARKIKIRKRFNICKKIDSKYKENDKIHLFIIIIGLVFVIITTVLLFLEIKRICAYYGFSSNNISNLLAFYRTKTELFSTSLSEDNISVNFIVKQMKKVCEVTNMIFAYLLIKKIVNKTLNSNIIETILLTITIIIGLLQTFLNSGGRSILMHFLVAYIVLYILVLMNKNQKVKISTKVIGKIAIVVVGMLVLFYALLPLIGRSSTINFVDYITFYLGSPIPSLSTFVEKNNVFNPQLGSETFSSVYYVLNRFNIIDYNKALTLEWLNFAPGLSSNVYTSLRAYYYDFGFIGVFILQFIFGLIYTKFYLSAKNSNKSFNKILYSYYFYILIDQIRAEQFYGLINTSTIAMLIIFIFLYRIILCNKNKKEIGYEIKENKGKD